MHSGTTDFLKMVAVMGFIIVAVSWIAGIVGDAYALLIVGAVAVAIVFAAGALFAHMSQKQTFDAITKFNAQDAQIDRYRMQSFKATASGESAMQRAAAQLTVLDAKRVDKIAEQRAKMLTDNAQQPQTADTWTWDDDSVDADSGEFQTWE
ncbi:MAG: hypothetical protein R2867_00975 [Caldilineaceae bacterium]